MSTTKMCEYNRNIRNEGEIERRHFEQINLEK